MSPGAYIFQRPFLRGLFLERLRCTEGNLCFKIDGLACSGEKIYHNCFVFTLYSRANFKHKPLGCAHIWRGNLTEGFLRYDLGGLIIIWRGLYMEGLDYFSEFYCML